MFITGASMRSLSSQYGCFHFGQRVQPEKSQDDTQVGQIDERYTIVWQNTEKSSTNGTSDTKSTGSPIYHFCK